MTIAQLIELFELNDEKKYDTFFAAYALAITRISKSNNKGQEVDEGEITTIYTWKHNAADSHPTFNYINFTKWTDDSTSNLLDIQFREETIYKELLQQVLELEDFENYSSKRTKRKDLRFFNSKRKINIMFLDYKYNDFPVPVTPRYTVVMNGSRIGLNAL
jgi:hypothetical protein